MINTKPDVKFEDLKEVNPALWILITGAYFYCIEYNLPFEITSVISGRENLITSSKTHEEGRAVDISVKGWTDTHIHRFVYLFNRDYSDIAAIPASDFRPRAAVYHDAGYGDHIHLQVRPNAPVNKFVSFKE